MHKCTIHKNHTTGAWTITCRSCSTALADFFGIPTVIGTKATFDGAVRRAVAHHKQKNRPRTSAVFGGYVPLTPWGQGPVIDMP